MTFGLFEKLQWLTQPIANIFEIKDTIIILNINSSFTHHKQLIAQNLPFTDDSSEYIQTAVQQSQAKMKVPDEWCKLDNYSWAAQCTLCYQLFF